jgi:2-amino-4-hydroxy-6-hydroxymethyldihydropteridine diphosphokinase
MPTVLVGLGSNLGDRLRLLTESVKHLSETHGINDLRVSSWHETSPIGGATGQGKYLNGAALLETELSPGALLSRLRQIEQSLGRERRQQWGPRTIDLDLLLYDQLVMQTPDLELPHPRMAYRRFVLDPASEIAGAMLHPTIGWTIDKLLEHLKTAVPYVAVSGSNFLATHALAAVTAKTTGWKLLEIPSAGDESVPTGRPRLTLSGAIEFLREQAEILRREPWSDRPAGRISSFWIEDLLAIGEVLWQGDLDIIWNAIAPEIVRPKLLVCYDAQPSKPTGEIDDAQTTDTNEAAELWQQLCAARKVRSEQPGIGPVLRLDPSDPVRAVHELNAAIQAMEG